MCFIYKISQLQKQEHLKQHYDPEPEAADETKKVPVCKYVSELHLPFPGRKVGALIA